MKSLFNNSFLGKDILIDDRAKNNKTASRFSNVPYVRVRSHKYDYMDSKGNKKYKWLDIHGKVHITKTHPEDLWAYGKIKDKWSYLGKGALLLKEALKLIPGGGNQITKQPGKFVSQPDWFYKEGMSKSSVIHNIQEQCGLDPFNHL